MRILFTLVALTVVSLQGSASAAADQKPMASLSGHELDRAVHDALRHWAKPAGDRLEPAARAFLALYDDLQQDTALAQSTRDGLSSKVRSRLAELARLLRKQAGGEDDEPGAPEGVDRAGQNGFLPQRGGPFGGNRGARPRPQSRSPRDAGADLVDLIERTISPRSWARNGGPGTIRYWPPGRALVARAPDDVHDHIGEMLEQLGRMRR